MILPRFEEARKAFSLHHAANILLSIAFLVTRGIPELCQLIFAYEGECEVESREREILFFLAVIIVWKGRKATNWLHYIQNIFMFSKLANIFLFLRADPVIGIVYLLLCVVVSITLPEPAYKGPEVITYFNGPDLMSELDRDRRSYFVIMFYATWSPDCKHVNPIFADLSDRFNLPNLKFGKLDLGRWPNEAEKFCVNAHPTSRQLPTVCVFKDAKEIKRRPLVGEKRRAIPFVFTQENCIQAFDLLNIHKECKEGLSKHEKKIMEEKMEKKTA